MLLTDTDPVPPTPLVMLLSRLLPAALTVLSLNASSIAGAQASHTSPASPPPSLSVTAVGEVEVTPDRARLVLGVETEAPTAQDAAKENANRQSQVMAALRAQRVPAENIRTTGYSVAPKQSYDPTTQQWRVDGYRVTNLVVVTLAAIDRTGAVIDATLAAGANRVADLRFEVSDPSAARDRAITRAVERARREAGVASAAAGGSVVALLELTILSTDIPSPRPMMEMVAMRAEGAETPISEGTQTVRATVATRWEFRGKE